MPSKVTYLIGAGASHNAHQLAKANPNSRTYSESLFIFKR